MGTLGNMLKLVAAPVYIPCKIIQKCTQPSSYEYWYHDSGNPTRDDGYDSRIGAAQDNTNNSGEQT